MIGHSVSRLYLRGQAEWSARAKQVLGGKAIRADNVERVRKDGSVVCVSVTITPIVDGDGVLFLAGSTLKRAGKLPGDVVVATVMSNLGLEKALQSYGISMVRTPVGDKYVLEEMLRRGAVLGGEQSGHVIFAESATTGDGLLTALRVLEILRDAGRPIEDLTEEIANFPQKLVNIRVKAKRPLAELESVQAEIEAAEREFSGNGRVVVRFSGTEPLARVMIEANSDEQVDRWTGRIADAIRSELGSV